eukprot:TRINITY_DN22197_c0_g1_i1.p1 TRINITY_DN22197_c0_g1~~TRINITY_DN22197_c0_g1_i1.p1  ORF type:complete len:640 (-),score=154.29 TRINITY_DN22197_c0_g1_i1:293-2212(-)
MPGPVAVLVSGAGSDDANGLYLPSEKLWHDAPIFENDRRCLLSREPHKSQKTGLSSYGWILGQDRKPIYAVQDESMTPPSSGWKKFTGEAPIPRVQGMDSLKDAAEAAALAMKQEGNTLFAARSYKEAEAKWSRALSLLDRHGEEGELQIALYANRAETKLRLSRWEEALADAEAALERKPTHDKAMLRGAVALRGLRRFGEAQAMVQRCLDADPRHSEAKQLLREIDQQVEGERIRMVPVRAKGAPVRDADISSIPRAFDTKDINNKNGLQAFSGYSDIRSGYDSEKVPVSELPYHKMGLPDQQVELMDNFFTELRAQKKQQAISQRRESSAYALVKSEYRQRALEDRALGKASPKDMPQLPNAASSPADDTMETKEDVPLPVLMASPHLSISRGPLMSEKSKLSFQDKAEIDELFKPFKAKTLDRRTPLEKQLDEEEAQEQAEAARLAQEDLQKLRTVRKGEPTRFEQAAGELYCWWALPAGITGKDVKVQALKGGERLMVQVRDVVIFDRPLFHHVRADDIVWSVDAGEISLTLTKGERSKLWDQLGAVGDVQFDESGKAVKDSIPEPMSGADRLEKFRQMVSGDDGHQTSYSELDEKGRNLVDAMRRFEHARATGDQNALALAEHDLEEFGKLVI